MEYLVDNTSVHALSQDPPGGAEPVLVFLHGAGMSHGAWSPLLSAFTETPAILAPDLPGHGRSGGPLLPDIAAMAQWLEKLLEEAGVMQACLVGHSMGALVALETAARCPDRVHSLALLGVAETMPVHPKLLVAAKEGNPQAVEMIVGWGHASPADPGAEAATAVQRTRQLLSESVPAVLYNDLAACNDYRQAAETAVRIDCPVLLVLGSEDRMTPAKAGRKLLDHLRNAQACQITGAGHMLMLEQPRETARALEYGLPDCFGGLAPETT
ncbi:alpha/beta fold hydrolase [Fodinicurvata halophila]|uniref:Alpha/beta fold hydrolase n=1 Tax=Fodinicurvata halophila TaxID=1419723 RepID=A0ABV8UR02_9PROT